MWRKMNYSSVTVHLFISVLTGY